MTARVILSSSALRIGKQDLLVDLHGVDHFGLIVIALKNLRARMLKHSHGQSYLGPVIDGSAGCQAGPERMRIDSLGRATVVQRACRFLRRLPSFAIGLWPLR